MKSRYITGAVYVLVLIALCALKWLVPSGWGALGFDAVFTAISVLGTLELLRAIGGVNFIQKVFTVAFSAVVVPLYVACQMAMGQGFLAVAVCGCIYAFALAALNVFHHGESTLKGTATCYFAMLYCGVLSCMLSAVNHVKNNSMAAVLTLFLIVMLTDSFAFITGKLLGKYIPRKLAPSLSPNKTLIGAAGGVIGGMAGAVAAYFIYFGLGKVLDTPLIYSGALHPAVIFMLIGLVGSVFDQIGDLFESAIKRECNVKDMGKLLPGHGGVLDRFDSILFTSVIVLVSFGLIIS